MSNNKLDPEKLKQLQQLMAMQGQMAGQASNKRSFSLKSIVVSILNAMQANIIFIDYLTRFIMNRKVKNPNDVVDSAKSPILFGMYTTIIFFVFGVLWAGFAPLDSATVAIGTVISNSQRKALNHQEGGIIKAIYVKLGDKVNKGDPLLEFDATKVKTEYESYLNQYRTLLASEARLVAEINKQEKPEYDEFLLKGIALPEVAKIIETQNNLFYSSREMKKAEKDSLAQRINQAKKEIEGLEARKVALIKNLEILQDRLDATKKLNAKGYAQKAALLEFEAREASAQSEIASTDANIARMEQEITKTEIDLLNLESRATTQLLTELKEVQLNLAHVRERYSALKDSLERVVLKSPVDGVVNNVNFHTVGSVIPPGQIIMEISPIDDHLIIEAKIDPKNIDSIHVGLLSKIRFSAFKSRTTPLFTGKVISLSPDIIVDPRADPRVSGAYYLARIELNMEEFKEVARTRKIELHPGMQAEVQIITGTRTLLKYLLDPVYDAMFKGFKEK